MDGWMDGRMDGWMDGRTDGRMDRWVDRPTDRWIDRQTVRQTEERPTDKEVYGNNIIIFLAVTKDRRLNVGLLSHFWFT